MMIRVVFASMLLLLVACTKKTEKNSNEGNLTPLYPNMKLVWEDEFNGTALNEGDWTFEIGDGCPSNCGWGNNELEYYQQANTTVVDGFLTIEARRESIGEKQYTSSRIKTQGKIKMKYGRVDVRAKLPEGQGIWPAIWMLGESIDSVGWPRCGEIDIMEMIGGKGREKTVHGTAHWWDDESSRHQYIGGQLDLKEQTYADAFHVFSIVWDATKIVWLVDDAPYYELSISVAEKNEFKSEFFFLMNVAVGGNWPGNPTETTKFPQRMVVDYIRVFQEE